MAFADEEDDAASWSVVFGSKPGGRNSSSSSPVTQVFNHQALVCFCLSWIVRKRKRKHRRRDAHTVAPPLLVALHQEAWVRV